MVLLHACTPRVRSGLQSFCSCSMLQSHALGGVLGLAQQQGMWNPMYGMASSDKTSGTHVWHAPRPRAFERTMVSADAMRVASMGSRPSSIGSHTSEMSCELMAMLAWRPGTRRFKISAAQVEAGQGPGRWEGGGGGERESERRSGRGPIGGSWKAWWGGQADYSPTMTVLLMALPRPLTMTEAWPFSVSRLTAWAT